jgi:hypothetical protein
LVPAIQKLKTNCDCAEATMIASLSSDISIDQR